MNRFGPCNAVDVRRMRPATAPDNTQDITWVRARLAECERWGCVNVAAVWREQLDWLEAQLRGELVAWVIDKVIEDDLRRYGH